MMRDQSIEEFESIFERASIPVLDIQDVALKRISAVLVGDALDESVLVLAAYLKERYGAEVEVLRSKAVGGDEARHRIRGRDCALAREPFSSTAELVGQIGIGGGQLVLLSEPEKEPARCVELDTLVEGTAPPILVIRTAPPGPREVFRSVLHSLTGNFRQTRNFAYSFTLTADGGRLMLIHAIAESELQEVRDTLRVSPEVAEQSGEALLGELTHRGERYLKAVVAASRERPFDVSYRLTVGEVLAVVREELDRGDYGMLVVGAHVDDRSHVTADDYQLMHQVRDIPVLAL